VTTVIQITIISCEVLDKLSAWSRVLLEMLTVTQLVKKFFTFYGTKMFITVYRSPGLYPEPDDSTQHPSYCQQNVFFSGDLFPSAFPTKILYTVKVQKTAS
jgi:hypothetical protein